MDAELLDYIHYVARQYKTLLLNSGKTLSEVESEVVIAEWVIEAIRSLREGE